MNRYDFCIPNTHTYTYKIKKLVLEYVYLEPGFTIDKYLELLKLSNDPEIYISRRALKHFVESRSKEMRKKFTKEDLLKRLYFAVDSSEEVFRTYDSLFIEDNFKQIYVKSFEKYPNFVVRIVTERVDNHIEVKSIHFQKTKKPPD